MRVSRRALLAAIPVAVGAAAVGAVVLASGPAGNVVPGGPVVKPPSKVTAEAQEQAARQRAPYWVAPKNPGLMPTPSRCPRALQPGIYPFDAARAATYLHEAGVRNIVNYAWVISSGLVEFEVRAGAIEADPEQGAIFVRRWNDACLDPGAKTRTERWYLTPYRRGAAALTKLDGDTVLFTTTGGATGRFSYVDGTLS